MRERMTWPERERSTREALYAWESAKRLARALGDDFTREREALTECGEEDRLLSIALAAALGWAGWR